MVTNYIKNIKTILRLQDNSSFSAVPLCKIWFYFLGLKAENDREKIHLQDFSTMTVNPWK